jgi:pilus assembly protein CpaB
MRRRWSTPSKVFALLALASGAGAFMLVRGYQARLEALRPAVGPLQQVVVAASALTRGTVLEPPALRIREIPKAFAPPGALTAIDQATGHTLGSDLAEGEPITRTRLGAADAGPVASLVPSGLRAVPVRADVPAGSVRPGDRVDVLATFGGQRPHTETVAQGLEVLLVLRGGSDVALQSAHAGAGAALVLLVSSDEAERLAFAQTFAELTIAIAPAES